MKRFAAFAGIFASIGLLLAAPAQARAAEPFRMPPAPPQKTWLRGVDPGTTGSIEGPSASTRPPCPPERKIGTGAGFCMIN